MPNTALEVDDFVEALERLYLVTLRPQLEGGFVAEIQDLFGCIT